MNAPRVSIGIPVYNGEKFIGRSLDSVLAQTFTDFEIVICDNASTDGTEAICREYAARDSRVRYHRNEKNIGAGPNFNRVFELSTAPLFRWHTHDDAMDPTCIERCVEVFDKNPDVVLVYPEMLVIDEDDNKFWFDKETGTYANPLGLEFFGDPPGLCTGDRPEDRFLEVLRDMSACQQLISLIRRDALLKTGLFRHYYGTDKMILADLSLVGKFAYIEDALFHKRVHSGISFFMSNKEKHVWMGNNGVKLPAQVYMLKDYFLSVTRADLTFGQRMRCYLAIRVLFMRHGLWRRIFVPGPDNYLGIEFNFGHKQTR